MRSKQTNEPSDLSTSALKKFADLVRADDSVQEEWKNVIVEMVKGGIPTELSALEKVLKESSNATT